MLPSYLLFIRGLSIPPPPHTCYLSGISPSPPYLLLIRGLSIPPPHTYYVSGVSPSPPIPIIYQGSLHPPPPIPMIYQGSLHPPPTYYLSGVSPFPPPPLFIRCLPHPPQLLPLPLHIIYPRSPISTPPPKSPPHLHPPYLQIVQVPELCLMVVKLVIHMISEGIRAVFQPVWFRGRGRHNGTAMQQGGGLSLRRLSAQRLYPRWRRVLWRCLRCRRWGVCNIKESSNLHT